MVDNRSPMRRIAWVAIGLFVAGLLLPFITYAIFVSRWMEVPHQRAVNIAAGIGAACELLALALGVIGWRHVPGKVAAIGAGGLIGLVALAVVTWMFRR